MAYDSYFVSYPQTITRLPLKESTMKKALDLMFDTYIYEEQKKEFFKLMESKYKKAGCVVLYSIPTFEGLDWLGRGISEPKALKKVPRKFSLLCQKFGLDPKRREVVINEKQDILFSEDYTYPPRVWCKK